MKAWSTGLLPLLLLLFSTAVFAGESPAQAITRLYQPLVENSDKILSGGFIVDLRTNANVTKGGTTPWLNNNLLCRCQDEMFVSAELIDTTPLNAGRIHALVQLTLNKENVGAHRLLGLTLVRDRDSELWLVEDTDDGSELPKSLRSEIREDTRIKSTATSAEPGRDSFSWPISMAALLANPEKYHLQKIVVIGVGNIEFEGNALFLDKDAWLNNVDGNSLWLDIGFPNPVITLAKARQLNGDYVMIAGTFDMDMNGHFGAWPGGITDITRYERVATRAENERKRQQDIKELEAEMAKQKSKK